MLVAPTSPTLAIVIAGFLPLIASYIFATTKATEVSAGVSQLARTGALRDLKGGWTAFSSRPWIWSIDLQFAIWHLVTYAPIIALGPLVAKEYYHGASGWAAILAALAVGGLIGGVVAFRSVAKHPLRLSIGSLVLMAPFPAALGLHLSLGWVALTSLLAGAGLEYSGAPYSFSVQAHVPREVISRVSSFDYLASVGLLPVGYVLAVPLAHLLSLVTLFIIGAVYTLFSAIIILSVRSVWNLPPLAAHKFLTKLECEPRL